MSFLFKAADRSLIRASERQLESTLARELESTGARELETVAKGFKHEVQDTKLALKLARENNAGSRLAGLGEGAGKFVKYAAPASVAAYGLYNLQQLPGRIVGDLEQVPEKVGTKLTETMDKVNEVVADGYRQHMPNKSSIDDAVAQVLSSAQDTAAAVHLTDTALTIGVVLLGSVVAYEAFRYFRA